MPITFSCACGKTFTVGDTKAGLRTRCKACGHVMTIPAPAAPVVEDDHPLAHVDDEYDLAPTATPAPQRTPRPAPAPRRPRETEYVHAAAGQTIASNPGRLTLNPFKHVIAYPLWPLIWVAAVAAGLWLAQRHRVEPALVLASLAAPVIYYFFHAFQKYHKGDVNPGIIVAKSPTRVAVLANLTTGRGGSRPAIKVVLGPLIGLPHGAGIGTRVATIAMYQGSFERDAWSDIEPEVIDGGVSDRRAIDVTLAAIPESEWRELESRVGQLDGTMPALHTHWDRNETGRNQRFSAGLRGLIKIAVLLVFVGGGGTGWRTPIKEIFADKRGAPQPPASTNTPAQAKSERTKTKFPLNTPLIDQVNYESQDADAPAPAPRPWSGPQRQPEPPLDDPALPAMTFAAGDKVEANWSGSQWSKATILKVSGKYARIRYEGWGPDWDEWFPADRLRRPSR